MEYISYIAFLKGQLETAQAKYRTCLDTHDESYDQRRITKDAHEQVQLFLHLIDQVELSELSGWFK